MFTEELTLADATPANHVYSTVITGDYRRVRRVASTNLDDPELLTISHQLNKDGTQSRSLVRFDTTVEDAAGTRGVVSVQLVVVIPRQQADPTDVKHVIKQLQNFLSASGYQDKLINLES
jgi:hypothetical protein